jgi:dienelactone hydrolase
VTTAITTTNYTVKGKTVACECYTPAITNGGAVVIAYGSDGMIDNAHGKWATMLREYAGDLAAKGYTAIIPNYFLTTGTAAGSIDYQGDGAQIVFLNRSTWALALNEAITHATTLPGIDPKRIGLVGFSLGGHLGLRLRSSIKVLVEFFAPWLDGIGAGGPGSPLQVQIHHGKTNPATGTGDSLVPFDANAMPIVQQLKREGVSADLHEYLGAGHGFVGTDPANTNAAAQSKARTLAFLQSHL